MLHKLCNTKGFIAVFFAFLFPLLLWMCVLIIDGGIAYVRNAELTQLAQASANSGLIHLSQKLKEKADENFTSTCSSTLLAVCTSTNIYDFLSTNEIDAIISDSFVQDEVMQNVQSFVQKYDPAQANILDGNITVDFPTQYILGAQSVSLEVEIQDTPKYVFKNFLEGEGFTNQMTVKAIAKLPLQ